MNTELRTKAKNNFEKESFEQMNNSVIGKTMCQMLELFSVRAKLSNSKMLLEKSTSN